MSHLWVVEFRSRVRRGEWSTWRPYESHLVNTYRRRRDDARSAAAYLRGCCAPQTREYRVRKYARVEG